MARPSGSTVADKAHAAPTAKATKQGRHAGPWGASFDGTQPNGTTPVKGLTFERRWTRPGVHPYDEITWEYRTAGIANESGKSVFEQKDVEVPDFWSQLATNVVVSKYFRGHLNTPERETSVRQLIDRVVNTITAWAETQHYFATDEDLQTFKAELTHLIVHQKMAFNSPVWFNVGIEQKPQCSACQPFDALVSTPDGMIPIGRLVEDGAVGREVYDANGVTRIVAVKNNGFKPVRRIRLRNGNFVEATPDHVVKAVRQRRGQPEWLPVDQLAVGMRMHLHPHRARVAAPEQVAVAAISSPTSSGLVGLAGDLIEQTPAETERAVLRAEAALAGWLQADGFVGQYDHGTNRSLTIEFQVANDDEYRWVMDNLDVALPHVHVKVRDAATKTTRVQRIRLYGETVRDFVERWGLLTRGTDMRVPDRLWTASYDEVTAYLRSIFQADGYVSVQRGNGNESARIGFAVIGERWSEDVQLLLNSIGIYSRRTRKHERRENRHDLHEVAVSVGSERARFAELIGFVGRAKQTRLLESLGLRRPTAVPNVREEEIVAIEDLGVQEVYDIQTESGEYLSNNVAVHNCFINSVQDTMSSIMDLAKTEAMLFKFGSGAGSNLSTIRSSREKMTGGGTASGPVSFMKGYDSFASVVKSGGKTRRAAKMVILDAGHPDILDFIDSKAHEEQKAWALIEAGYDPSFTGEAYGSVFFQNANHSVRVTDAFMQAVVDDKEWQTHAVVEPHAVMDTYRARDIFHKMADAAHLCGDPGIQYDTTINEWHTSANSDRIHASNPCSEYMFLNDTACNLASLNLMKFVGADGEFDVEDYRFAAKVTITAQEILVDNASYPTPRIEENSHKFRPLGLGYANLGALLMSRGLAYDSDEGRNYAAALTAIMHGEAYRQSAEIARDHGGPFASYPENREPFLKVIGKHRDAAYRIPTNGVPPALLKEATVVFDEALALGEQVGYRNAQVTVLAPTGTIAFMMDCDTTGVEPDIALIKYKKLVGEGFLKIVNQTVPAALRKLGYGAEEVDEILAYLTEHETIEGAPHLKPQHLPVFDCAFKPANGERSIHYMGHVRMMGAIQPFISGAISKTVNMPENATSEEIEKVYLEGWKLGLKAIAVYRDNSKRSQPLSTGKKTGDAGADIDSEEVEKLRKQLAKAEIEARLPHRRRLPAERSAITHKFDIAGHEGYITVGLYPDGQPGEIFLKMAKEGSTVSGLMDTLATTISVALQYGVPLKDLVNKFAHVRFEPSGFTGNQEIPIAKSIVDYIFRWLGSRFLSPEDRINLGLQERVADDAAPAFTPFAFGGGSSGSASSSPAEPTPAIEVKPSEPGSDAPKATAVAAESAAEPLAVIATNGSVANGHAANGNAKTTNAANGGSTAPITLNLGGTKVSFQTQADAPSCMDCGSIMVRNGSCYKCLNCGSTSGCS